jgi:hypothetical protein
MFDQLKPGHVLRFGVCPSTINAPPGPTDPKGEFLWTGTPSVGAVTALSHPSGPIGKIAAEVALGARPGSSNARSASYSAVGRAVTASDRRIGSVNADFVGYLDGRSQYVETTQTVLSSEFSGCLMVVYKIGGQRRVAHVPTSHSVSLDCKQAFLDTIKGKGATLEGWFRPFVSDRDSARKASAFTAFSKYFRNQIDNLPTFGVVTSTGQCYAFDAFKPTGIPGSDWVVTYAGAMTMKKDWTVSYGA